MTEAPDPRVLRAVAHPTRSRILAELGAAGPLRAADVAHALGIPANQASFHLRQLAKYGLVEEAPDAARDRRDRVWRMTSDSGIRLELTDFEATPGGKAAVTVFRRNAVEWGRYLVERAVGVRDRQEGEHRTINDTAIRLTDEEQEQFSRELDEFVHGWVERTRGSDGGRRTYSLYTIFQTYPGLAPDEGE